MKVIANGPLRGAALTWQQKPGRFMTTVTCKITYHLAPDECTIAPGPTDLHVEDQYLDDNPSRSLVAPRDLVPCKRSVEVVLVGSAYAPRKEAVSYLVARLQVGKVNKSLAIHADRHMTPAGFVRETIPFVRMPLRYERAAWSADNPVGMRFERPRDGKPIAIPNILPVGLRITGFDEPIPSVGFGPIAPSWPSRSSLMAKTSPLWTAERWTSVAIPERFETRFFDVAPADQQLTVIAADETITLENLHPQHPRLVTRLPGIMPRGIVETPGKSPSPLEFVADVLWLDVDQSICTVTYRAYLVSESATPTSRVRIDVPQSSYRLPAANAPIAPPPRASQPGPPVPIATSPKPTIERVNFEFDEDEVEHTERIDLGGNSTPKKPDAATTQDGSPETQKMAPAPVPLKTTLVLNGPVPLNPAVPFVPAPVRVVEAAPAAKTPPAPVIAGQTPAPNPSSPANIESPIAIAKTPPRIVVKARSSTPIVEAEQPRVASLDHLEHLQRPAHAAPGSAAALSDAAAQGQTPRPIISPAPTPAPKDVPTAPAIVLELLWFDPTAMESIRAEPGWKKILDERHAREGQTNAPRSAKKTDTPEHRDLRVLLVGTPLLGSTEVKAAMTNAIDDLGGFVPPLVLLAGDLVFPFDEFETLKATLAAVLPFMKTDKKLEDLVNSISELLRTPWLTGAGGASEGLTAQIRSTFAEKNRGLPTGYLEAQTERVLLEKRHHQKRIVFKQPHLRSLLNVPGSSEPIPTYLPAQLSQELPAFQRFRARIIAESHVQVDQHETSSVALRAVALSRELPGLLRK